MMFKLRRSLANSAIKICAICESKSNFAKLTYGLKKSFFVKFSSLGSKKGSSASPAYGAVAPPSASASAVPLVGPPSQGWSRRGMAPPPSGADYKQPPAGYGGPGPMPGGDGYDSLCGGRGGFQALCADCDSSFVKRINFSFCNKVSLPEEKVKISSIATSERPSQGILSYCEFLKEEIKKNPQLFSHIYDELDTVQLSEKRQELINLFYRHNIPQAIGDTPPNQFDALNIMDSCVNILIICAFIYSIYFFSKCENEIKKIEYDLNNELKSLNAK